MQWTFQCIRSRRGRTALAAMALVALVGAAYFYWQSLVSDSVTILVGIPAEQMQASPGLAVWPLPNSLRHERWHRTPVRLRESGTFLPLRVDDEDLVMDRGHGRFCIQGEKLWFSPSDNTNPATNARKYDLEIQLQSRRKIIAAVVLLPLAAGLLVFVFPWRHWLQNLVLAVRSREGRFECLRLLGLTGISLAALLFAGAQLLGNRTISMLIPSGAFRQQADESYRYFLPRWIRTLPWRTESLILSEDQKVPASSTYTVTKDELCLSPADLSTPPSIHRHSYRLEILLIHRTAWNWLGLYFLAAGAYLFLYARSFQKNNLPSFERAAWWGAVAAVCLLKLWVIAGDDVIGQVADGLGYAQRANVLIWGGPNLIHGHPVGFPLVAGLVSQIGIPWRLAQELFYLAICLYLTAFVVQIARSRLLGLMLFAALAWHPWTLSGFPEFMPDPLTLLAVAASLVTMFRLFSKPPAQWTWPPIAALGLFLFVWESARDEEPLLAFSYVIFILLALIWSRWQAPKSPWLSRRSLAMLLTPLLIVFALESTSRTMMYHRYGVYAKSGLNLPGVKALCRALYRVRPEETLRYAPVTRQSLAAACDASPALQPYKKVLLDPNANATLHGQRSTQIPGEFGPYLYWLIFAIQPGDARIANETMLKGAREIQSALAEGRLPKRFAWWPLDPNWKLWLPDLPGCFATWFGHGTSMSWAGEPWGTYRQPLFQHTFDEAANRRAGNIYPHLFLGQGAVTAPPNTIDSVAVADLQGRWRTASIAYPSNWWDNGQAFELRFPVDEPESNYRLLFLRQGAVQYSVPLTLLSNAYGFGGFSLYNWTNEFNLNLPNTSGAFSYQFIGGITDSDRKARRVNCEAWLHQYYKRLLKWGLGLVFAGMLMMKPWAGLQLKAALLCLVLVASWFTLRAAFYGLLVAMMEFGQERYMRCVSPLFVVILFLMVLIAGAGIRRWFGKKTADEPREFIMAHR